MVDLYFSFRSPYSYFILPRIIDLKENKNININFKVVYPLAIREPEFFKGKNLFTYFLLKTFDYMRVKKRLNMEFNPPKPDPIKQNILTGKISSHQPIIFEISHMGQDLTNRGFGLEFAYELSKKIWSEKNWNSDENITKVLKEFDVDLDEIRKSIKVNEEALINQIKQNQKEQLEAGHHGVPLTVYKETSFFGQDRFHDLVSLLKSDGMI